MNSAHLLIEFGTEELPASHIKSLSEQLALLSHQSLTALKLKFSAINAYATPRRLALVVHSLQERQEVQVLMRRGPALNKAYDETGKPTQALLGFAKSCGVSADDLEQQTDPSGTYLYFRQEQQGQSLATLLGPLLEQLLDGLSFPRKMFWGRHPKPFIRPLQWLTLDYPNVTLKTPVYGLNALNHSFGHRFHHPQALAVTAENYERALQQAFVIADWRTRSHKIESGLIQLASAHNLKPLFDDDLLEEVCGLTEWPVCLLGRFKEAFLNMPPEVLITAMRNHQRCFPFLDEDQKLSPYFGIVANIESTNPSLVIQGNEKVMHARLSDAVFHYAADCKATALEWQERLKQVVYQKNLGSVYDKTQRLSRLAGSLAPSLSLDCSLAARAAELCKLDLMSHMVAEFPELQGVMGGYYLARLGENSTITKAIQEHYHPRFAQDSLPQSQLGGLLALVDRLDNLAALFALGKSPAQDKDPFALRRQALAVIRLLSEVPLDLDLAHLLEQALVPFQNLTSFDTKAVHTALSAFCVDRLKAYHLEQGATVNILDALCAVQIMRPYDFSQRLKALQDFLKSPLSASLSAANKRVANLLSKSSLGPASTSFKEDLLVEPAERILYRALKSLTEPLELAWQQEDYPRTLELLVQLKAPIDTFFEEVRIMCDDLNLQNNRLGLLSLLRSYFLKVADFSLL